MFSVTFFICDTIQFYYLISRLHEELIFSFLLNQLRLMRATSTQIALRYSTFILYSLFSQLPSERAASTPIALRCSTVISRSAGLELVRAAI